VTLKTLAFLFSSFAAIFSASAGSGLLKIRGVGISSDADIGIAEFLLGAYAAKNCFW
jgi:hypothetical protein